MFGRHASIIERSNLSTHRHDRIGFELPCEIWSQLHNGWAIGHLERPLAVRTRQGRETRQHVVLVFDLIGGDAWEVQISQVSWSCCDNRFSLHIYHASRHQSNESLTLLIMHSVWWWQLNHTPMSVGRESVTITVSTHTRISLERQLKELVVKCFTSHLLHIEVIVRKLPTAPSSFSLLKCGAKRCLSALPIMSPTVTKQEWKKTEMV